ncbi:MAG: NAD(P)H-hydrate dehydratase [Candidatus Latescibacterota bacterium]|nr:MAG: NAD(P)H-hydrate dehydratase [Candidatus Latescibacterota bacterium]
MDILTNERMKRIDEDTIARFCPGLELMERAGRKTAEYILDRFPEDDFRAAIFVGPGNNGGDGLVIARILADKGRACSVLYLIAPEKLPMDAYKNYERLRKRVKKHKHLKEINLTRSDWVNLVGRELADSSLVVDGLFGTGLTRALEGAALEIVKRINECGLPVISIDTPSGINGDSGEVLGDAIVADGTVTMGCPKLGLTIHPGKSYVGELVIADLGFPDEVVENHSMGVYLLDRSDAASRLSPRRPDAHKYSCGTALIVSGSQMYTGATILTAEAALRSGCGMVYAAVPASIRALVEPQMTEVITIPVPETSDGTIAPGAWGAIQPYLEKADALVMGPGLSRHPETTEFVFEVLAKNAKPIIIDADGINALEGQAARLQSLDVPAVITPHSGELARLLGKSIPSAAMERIETTRETAQSLGVTLVHKGAPTLISASSGHVWINHHGNSALATAGTGDVLTGLIGGLLAQGEDPLDAACMGCFLHGRAGEIASWDLGLRGVIAGDLISVIGEPMLELEATAATNHHS